MFRIRNKVRRLRLRLFLRNKVRVMNEPEVRVTLPPEAESVWSIFIQKMGQNMAEVKHLNDKSPPCRIQLFHSAKVEVSLV